MEVLTSRFLRNLIHNERLLRIFMEYATASKRDKKCFLFFGDENGNLVDIQNVRKEVDKRKEELRQERAKKKQGSLNTAFVKN